MKPARYRGKQDHFETMRHNLNGALSFCGAHNLDLSVQEDGELISVKKAKTLTEAARPSIFKRRDVHPDVLKFSRPP